MTPERGDVWGMTECFDSRYHLQSYFLMFLQRAIQDPAFMQYWRNAPYVDARGWLIHHGEVGLTQSMLRAGLTVRALFPSEAIGAAAERRLVDVENRQSSDDVKIAKRGDHYDYNAALVQSFENGAPLNPTHFFWEVLIADLGYPFIKRDLLQLNPVNIPNLSRWRTVIGEATDYDRDLIRRHLLPRLRNRRI